MYLFVLEFEDTFVSISKENSRAGKLQISVLRRREKPFPLRNLGMEASCMVAGSGGTFREKVK